MSTELVSVVIPTRNRPSLVMRAVNSALRQSYKELEVIVVVDGPDTPSNEVLQQIQDSRIRVIPLAEPVGGSNARNIGADNARGQWVAFLDDDDEWLTPKIECQIAAAASYQGSGTWPIVSCRLFARTPKSESIWPRKDPHSPLSEYLFNRTSWTYGDGILQTSTLMTSRLFLKQVPFASGMRKHQDLDWILRAVAQPGVDLIFVKKPLVIWNLRHEHRSVSNTTNWRFSLEWLHEHRSLLTQRAYAGFVATEIAHQAAAQRAWGQFVPLLREMVTRGTPDKRDILTYFGMWVPQNIRKNLATVLG